MPYDDPHSMEPHLAEISAMVEPGAHAVVIVDQASWHMSPKLAIGPMGSDQCKLV
ncbi:MAG: hypothetical protein V3R90_10655 [Limibaculum sp.]